MLNNWHADNISTNISLRSSRKDSGDFSRKNLRQRYPINEQKDSHGAIHEIIWISRREDSTGGLENVYNNTVTTNLVSFFQYRTFRGRTVKTIG
ncbi:Hypothetical protein NTJ_15518 [Nesidiocoris tenuis]|nr:Hypothetical protein NTJ_15518 [Nesidiocoris tenuis]